MYEGILIKPALLYSHVAISDNAWLRLKQAQSQLPIEIQLILYRGYQPYSTLRTISRRVGSALFKLIYPVRRGETRQIFSANGHESDGDHIDIGISVHGEEISLLPLSVFTPLFLQQRRRVTHRDIVDSVQREMCQAGFLPHKNSTEALVMHFDLPEIFN
jgi:hypothetical protein